MTDAAFPIWQSLLPNRLGISIEEVRARRDLLLVENVDWKKAGNRVLFTLAAEKTLAESLSVPLPSNALPPQAAPEENSDPSLPPEKSAAAEGVLVVIRSAPQIRNQRIVECSPEGSESRCLLWVKDNTKFRPGHRIPLHHTAPRQEGQFTYIAARPPK